MKKEFFETTVHYLRFQRNVFASLTFLLAASLILVSAFLFLKRERVVIVPPVIEKEFWVDADSISPTYLEQYGTFLGQLLLSKSAQSAPTQRSVLLRHTEPRFVEVLKQKLFEEEQLLQKQNAAYTFFPVTIHVDAKKKEVLIEGDRIFYVSGKQISCEREGYILGFHYTGSRLLLSGVTSREKRGELCAK